MSSPNARHPQTSIDVQMVKKGLELLGPSGTNLLNQ